MAAPDSALGPGARHARLEEFALQAFVFLVVYLIGTGVLIAFYYNLYVLDDYVIALFWAAICSIPVFQIKIRVIHAMLRLLDWWWSVEYLVLNAADDGSLHLQPLASWAEGPPGAAEVEGTREDLALPPEAMPVTELRQRLASGEELHAVVQHRKPPDKDKVVSVVKRGHWLGTLRPYESLSDFVGRDLPSIWSAGALQAVWIVKPLRRFYRGEEGSQPYFGLLIRLCVLHFFTRFLGASFFVVALFLGVHLYLLLVAVRLAITLVAHLTPRLVPAVLDLTTQAGRKLPHELVDIFVACLRQLKVLVRRCVWHIRKRTSMVVHAWLAMLLDNSHFILSILIILVCLLAACKALSLLCLSLQHEAFVIWRTLHSLLQPSPFYQVAMSKFSHLVQAAGVAQAKAAEEGSAAGLWNFGQSLIETTVPEYQEWLQHNVPDFHILKYVLYDIWRSEDGLGERWLQQNSSLEALASLAGGLGASGAGMRGLASDGRGAGLSGAAVAGMEEEEDVCQQAIAVGASCVAVAPAAAVDQTLLHRRLQNTTALLRLLASRNFSASFSLLPVAYEEVAAASSLLGHGANGGHAGKGGEAGGVTMLDGALHGGTWVARLTMHGSIVFVHVLTIASSMLGQAIVFLTALFYLLASRVSCLEVIGEFLCVIDRSKVIFRISELVVRAVLLSALKMSAFHGLFTWLLYSWGQVPVVVVPTVLSALVALVPVVSPVWSVSVWAAVYLWAQGEKASAALALAMNLGVWWQVPSVIYAEIPESNPWLTGLSVVLGIGQFGAAGVVLGPMAASVPLICFNLVKLFNDQREEAPASTPRRHTLLTLYQSESFLSLHSEDRQGVGSVPAAPLSHWQPRSAVHCSREPERALRVRPRHSTGSACSSPPLNRRQLRFGASHDKAGHGEGGGDLVTATWTPSDSGQGSSDGEEAAEGEVQGGKDEQEDVGDSAGAGQESIPLKDLLAQQKHREVSERVLRSPGGPLLKRLLAQEASSASPQAHSRPSRGRAGHSREGVAAG